MENNMIPVAGQTGDVTDFENVFVEAEVINENNGAAQGGSEAFIPPPAAEDVEGAGDAPVFGEVVEEQEQRQAQDESEKVDPMKATLAETKLRFIISMVDKLLSKGCSKLAREVDKERWRFDDEEIEMLVVAWQPYMQKHGNKIPDNIELWFVTVWVLGRKVYGAVVLGRQNLRNEKLAKSSGVQQVVKVAEKENVIRNKFAIDNNGYYISHPKTGQYVKVADRVEKADLKDIEMLVRDNDIAVIRRAFPNLDTTPYESKTSGQGV
jgi:hypothetical protein